MVKAVEEVTVEEEVRCPTPGTWLSTCDACMPPESRVGSRAGTPPPRTPPRSPKRNVSHTCLVCAAARDLVEAKGIAEDAEHRDNAAKAAVESAVEAFR